MSQHILLRRRSLLVGASGHVLTADSAVPLGVKFAAPPGGTVPGQGWAQLLAASLEPGAVETLQVGAFSYVIASNVTKLYLAGWATQLGGAGRMELRDPAQGFVPLRGVTLSGVGSTSVAVMIDHTLPTYADAWATYYDRLFELTQLQTRYLAFTGTNQKKLLLPGPFGSVITSYTVFDLPWLCVRPVGGSGIGYNLGNEESDTDGQRNGNKLQLLVTKATCSSVHSDDTADGSPAGGVTWVNLPDDWSAIADALNYVFRDTFEAATLNTGSTWTRAVSTAGNIEIDATYNWLKCKGNNAWGNNGIFTTSYTVGRSGSPQFIVDFAFEYGDDFNGLGCFGFHDGAGNADTDFLHGINVGAKGSGATAAVSVLEAGTSKSTGLTVTEGAIYRFRITAQSGGGAVYEVQGGPEYPGVGSASWQTITPSGGSSGTTTPLRPGAAAFGGSINFYLGDLRVVD